MTDHFDLTDDAFYDLMESGELRKKHFSHSAHLRLAWIHIHRYGAKEAESTIARQIKAYITRIGMGYAFNITLTLASVRILEVYINQSSAKDFKTLVTEFPELQTSFREVIGRHYSDFVFMDKEARSRFLEPNRLPFSYVLNRMKLKNNLYPRINDCCDQLITEFDQISEDRKVLLEELATYIAKVYNSKATPQLVVICTHNSRRSHMGQLWLPVAANYYGLPVLDSYSGGTEGTAFYKSAVAAMRDLGYEIDGDINNDNPRYYIRWNADLKPYEAFSKRYDDSPNPTSNFGAIMVCTSADEACPFVQGADFRIALPFHDPKAYDGTEIELEKYKERSRDIGREILYVMSRVRHIKTFDENE